jgi:hypothetical protein
MGDGIIEDLQSVVDQLHGTVVELCREAGHDWQPRAKYDYCPYPAHAKSVQHEIRHRIACEVCHTWKCEAQNG